MAAVDDSRPKAFYVGHETRFNLSELEENLGSEKSKSIKEIARSVGCLTLEKHFRKEGDSWILMPRFFSDLATLEDVLKATHTTNDVKVNFQSELVLGRGTAFIIGHSLILTAGHCFYRVEDPTQEVEERPDLFILDFAHLGEQKYEYKRGLNEEPPVISFKKENVYRIKSILAHELTQGGTERDWAVLQLDREIENDSTPLEINFSAQIEMEQKLSMIGHAMGLPLKLTRAGAVKKVDSVIRGNKYFESNLAAFTANSGSPVFFGDDPSGPVIGMLCYGHKDYGKNQEDTVVELFRSEPKAKRNGFESVLKMTTLSFLQRVLSSIDIPPSKKELKYQPGLSLEGVCKNISCGVVVHHVGFKVIEEIGELIVTAKCPNLNCAQPLPWASINQLILANCTYEIEGKTEESSEIIKGTFSAIPIDKDGGILRLDIQRWHYITLKVSKLN